MYIKKFRHFLNEEVIIGKNDKPLNLDEKTRNRFVKIFNSDTLAVKQFIQKQSGEKNLRYLGGGGIGLAFLTDEGKVLKFTADEYEKKGVERMLELAPGDEILPGFAKYYWIKGVDLPVSDWSKSSYRFSFKTTHEQDVNRIEQLRQIQGRLKSKDLDPARRYELEQRLQRLKKLNQEFVDRRKLNKKVDKVYIICLENLKLLNKIESEIVHNIFLFMSEGYLNPGDEDNRRKLSEFYDWLQNDQEIYTEPTFINGGFDKKSIVSRRPGLTKSNFFGTNDDYKKLWRDEISKSYFLEFISKVLTVYARAKLLEIPSRDIHEGNLGFRGDELVAFDCM